MLHDLNSCLVYSFIRPPSGIKVSDSDFESGGALLTVRLSVLKGYISLGDAKALIFNKGGSTRHRVIEFRAPLDATNRALSTLRFDTPTPTWSGSDVLSVSVDDGGHSGLGGPMSDKGVVEIFAGVNTLQATNVPPTITAPKSLENTVGCSIKFAGKFVMVGLLYSLCH